MELKFRIIFPVDVQGQFNSYFDSYCILFKTKNLRKREFLSREFDSEEEALNWFIPIFPEKNLGRLVRAESYESNKIICVLTPIFGKYTSNNQNKLKFKTVPTLIKNPEKGFFSDFLIDDSLESKIDKKSTT